jgi:UDP-glucose 4-epimerase
MKKKGETIGIAGHDGFIGSHLVNRLKKDGRNCKIITPRTKKLENIKVLVNLVGSFFPPFEDQISSNLVYLNSLCERAIKSNVEKIIHISAAAAYGPRIKSKEDDSLEPDMLYGLAKKFGEELLEFYHKNHRLKYIVLRPPNIYGPGSDHGVISSFIDSFNKSGSITIFGDGEHKRDYLYIDDMIDAIVKSIDYDNIPEIFNIGTGKIYSLNDLAKKLENAAGKKIKIKHKKTESHSSEIVTADVAKVLKLLKFKAKTGLEGGLRETIKHEN